MPAAAFIMLSQPQPLTMSRVSRAMTSSSLVGITKSFTLLSAVEMHDVLAALLVRLGVDLAAEIAEVLADAARVVALFSPTPAVR